MCGTSHSFCLTSDSCRSSPFTLSQMRPCDTWPGGRADRGDRCGTVKAFSRILWLTPLPRGAMQITTCQIDTSSVAKHMFERTPLGNVTALAADRDHQLDLVLAVHSARRIRDRGAVRYYRIGGLHEEDRRIGANLAHLVRVIAAHAVDAVHGEALAARGHRHTRRRGSREDKIAH